MLGYPDDYGNPHFEGWARLLLLLTSTTRQVTTAVAVPIVRQAWYPALPGEEKMNSWRSASSYDINMLAKPRIHQCCMNMYVLIMLCLHMFFYDSGLATDNLFQIVPVWYTSGSDRFPTVGPRHCQCWCWGVKAMPKIVITLSFLCLKPCNRSYPWSPFLVVSALASRVPAGSLPAIKHGLENPPFSLITLPFLMPMFKRRDIPASHVWLLKPESPCGKSPNSASDGDFFRLAMGNGW